MSEVARIRQQIELELLALRHGLTGVASGYARHDFINSRMDRIGLCQRSLARYVGDQDALLTVCQLYQETMEEDELCIALS